MPPSEYFDANFASAFAPGTRLVRQATKFKLRSADYIAYARSGHKMGTFSKVEAIGHMVDDPATYLLLVIVHRKEGFMRQGDSGCWVLNALGQLEALGFAASPEMDAGYAIPIENVYEDIQKRLGATIVDPAWVE